ncbi:hypothetical protein HUT18_10745 [Streptomyces sp. NA04227]|uniref:hypothetical protein n=1 Tax=Streptomyces sp. NA04227 TaxID=2742136 RepID=UPI001590E973|nr:hypothetical protein [Streptomyces sp. NA04227]QKW06800.1 hypothetical protein HUT18_10745 [Streptomyces sp. NA04227]
MDFWREDAQPGHTHDPNEVTVQLDGAGRRLAELLDREELPGADTPVFVDESGRRGRTYRTLGVLVGLACAGYAAVIAVTLLSGNAGAPWLPVEGHGEGGAPPARVETSQLPVEPVTGASPTAGAPAAQGEEPGPAESGSPSGDASSQAPEQGPGDEADELGTARPSAGASADGAGPGASPSARPSTTPDPEPEGPVQPSAPGPSPTGAATTPAPAPSPASGGSAPLPVSESPGR